MKKLIVYAMLATVAPLGAQQSDISMAVPQISVAARGEVKVVPDRANIQISVQTQAPTAAAAATENARKQKAVIDAIRAAGVDAKDIATINYNVYPEQRYEPNREPVVIGYNVTNTLSVDLKAISLVGPVIDAALSKGANMITSLQFIASNTESARQEAIGIAVRKARADAEAAARAAGGSISGLLEVNVGAYFPPPPRPMEMKVQRAGAPAMADTPISAGDQTLAVDVNTRWRFVTK
jgi:uncharacterized protein